MKRTTKATSVILLLFYLGCSNLFSQELNGKVNTLDSDGKTMPAYGANVYWSGTIKSAVTNPEGKFKIETTSESQNLIISYVGCLSDTVKYTGQKFVEVTLKSVTMLTKAEIRARRKDKDISLANPLNVETIGRGELAKAACCNLSESFDTNASIDASFTDAVTGTKQIKMLGLDGKYSQIMAGNIPNIRGLSTVYGLSYIPGAWVDKIYVSQGVGSVTNGYESITGQINVALKNPEVMDKMFFNGYGAINGRAEVNAGYLIPIKDNLSTSVMMHGVWNDKENDRNSDGFLDNPLKKNIFLRNDWSFHSKKNIEGKYDITYLNSQQEAGQIPSNLNEGNRWEANLNAEKIEINAKTGFILKRPETSIGTQLSGSYYNVDNKIGVHLYNGQQQTFMANFLFASYIGTTDHKFKTGLSYLYDEYQEVFDYLSMYRRELVPGAFFEYSYNKDEVLSLIAGARVDENNLYGTFFSPRFHMRYSVTELSSIKVAVGRGYRTPNVIMENVGLLASNRSWNFQNFNSQGYAPEIAWNYGINYVQKFKLNYRDASVSVSAYQTAFTDKIVIDLDQSSEEVNIYNLEGESYANSAQIEFNWEASKRFDVRAAYRFLDVQTDYVEGRNTNPFTPEHRAFTNITFKSKEKSNGSKWLANTTIQWIGEQRIPDTSDKDEAFQLGEKADDFIMVNAQVNYYINKNFEFYVGAENVLDYKQDQPILDSENPFSDQFDASLVWAPVFGRNIYIGLNYTIPR